MMLLGLVLHSALGYATHTFGVFSTFHDKAHSDLLMWVIFFIHLFRMPLFFLLAGFFGNLLWHKYGTQAMLRNRVKRILLPLAGSWVFLFPLTILCAAFTVLGGPAGIAGIASQLENGALLAQNNLTFADLFTQLGLIHLWFLYFLMLFYIGMAWLLVGGRRLPVSVKSTAKNFIRKALYSPGGLVFVVVLTWLSLLSMPAANLHTTGLEGTNALLPPLRILIAYFVFFAFGWGLFQQQGQLSFFRKQAWQYTGLGVAAAGLYGGLILHPYFASNHLLQTGAGAAAIWLLSVGILGLSLRYTNKPSATFNYLSNASYWVYLVHLPLTLLLPGFLLNAPLPALLKFFLVCTGTTLLSLLSYQWFVRSTRLGLFFNGRQLTPYRFFSRLRRRSNKERLPLPATTASSAPQKSQSSV